MNENFFADYKKFIVVPEDETKVGKEEYDPKKYAAHYILTLSIFNSRIANWWEANKYEIDIEKSIKTVLKEFNEKQQGKYYLQLLELDKFTNYFILALSSKTKFEPGKESDCISAIIDKMLMNPFYIGQNWFNLIGERGRVERKLFRCSFKEYIVEDKVHEKGERFENISELIPKSGEIKLIKGTFKKDVL